MSKLRKTLDQTISFERGVSYSTRGLQHVTAREKTWEKINRPSHMRQNQVIAFEWKVSPHGIMR
jgi:hypothetical protein